MLKDNIHWLSYTRHEGPNGTSICVFPATGCMVSIVLDDDARYHFSAIRLLVVCPKSKKLDYLNIEDCPNLRRQLFVADRTGSSTTYRTRLSRRRAAYQSSRRFGSSAAPTSGLPICNIVFQLIDAGKLLGTTGGPPVVTLSLLGYSEYSSSSSPVRVAYDRVHRVDPNNPSLLAFLNINAYFDPLPPDLLETELPSAIPVHSIRVLPKSGRPQSRGGTLPPHIISHIVDFAIGRKPIGWRPALLAYSLVCKSWAHVLDLFFGRFDGSFEERKVEVRNVARSLKARPERGALMRTLDTRDYKKERSDNARDTPTFHSGIDGWHDFLKIIQCATSARVVHLQAIPRSFTAEVVDRLSNLREVRRCSLYDNKDTLSMADIQDFIASWVHLDNLEVFHWAREHDAQQSTTNHIACNIEVLFLRDGVISGRQLLRLVASPTPQLGRLDLHQVHGVSNRDFRSFLTIAAPTLRHVSIAESPMPCSYPDEELAVDAVMPEMKVLEHLMVPGTHASALAIARKVAVAQTLSSITIYPANPRMTLGQVAEALEVTGWKGVLLRWGEAPLEWDEALKTKALNAAKERGVVFHCWVE